MEDNDLKAVRAISVAVTVCVLVAVGGCHFTNRVALNKGLCQGSIQGQAGYFWVPCAKDGAR